MRYIKYLFPICDNFFLAVWIICYKFLHISLELTQAFGLIILASSIKLALLYHVKRQMDEHKVVALRHKRTIWHYIKSSIHILGIFSVFYVITYNLEYTTITFLIASITIIILLIAVIISYRQGDFYIDKDGIIQPELFNKNYTWDEIDNFEILPESLSFTIDNNDVTVSIDSDTSERLKWITQQSYNTF